MNLNRDFLEFSRRNYDIYVFEIQQSLLTKTYIPNKTSKLFSDTLFLVQPFFARFSLAYHGIYNLTKLANQIIGIYSYLVGLCNSVADWMKVYHSNISSFTSLTLNIRISVHFVHLYKTYFLIFLRLHFNVYTR